MTRTMLQPKLKLVEISKAPIRTISELDSSVTQQLYQWWHGFSPELPSRTEFDPVEHRAIANSLFLVGQTSYGQFEYRLNAEEVADAVGRVPIGSPFSKEDKDAELATLATYYQHILEVKIPFRCTGTLIATGGDHVPFESLDCPLFNSQGQAQYIIGAFTTYPLEN